MTITLLSFPVDRDTDCIYETDVAQILMCNQIQQIRLRARVTGLVWGGGKASFPALCSDMAYLTCFSWSHCSRTVHENMKGGPIHAWEQWASLETQTHTPKQKRLQYNICVWVKACTYSSASAPFLVAFLPFVLTSVFLFLFPNCVFPVLNLPLSLRNKGHSISFHSSPLPLQCHLSKIPQTDKRTKKKGEIID